MFHTLLLIVLSLTFFSCSQHNIDGNWKVSLNLQETELPFNLEISDNSTKAKLYNGAETLELDIKIKNNKFIIPIQSFDNALVLEKANDKESLKGQWIKYNKKNEYRLNLKAVEGEWEQEVEYPDNFPMRWKISFLSSKGEVKDAILLFTNDHATILTPTGDYRYLRPHFNGKKLNLYGFDGAFSFNFDGFLTKDSFTGTVYSGLSWNQTFKARPSETFKLPDATKVTTIPSKSLNFCLNNLQNEKKCISTKDNRAKVIQIFGSWCPNCIDETRFIKEFRSKNKVDVDFYIISFERGITEKISKKNLKKAIKTYSIDYPVLIGGLSKSVKVSDIFKDINNFASFPTTIFVSKKGKVTGVHSGFNGPATGKYYEDFTKEFSKLIKKIQE